jgi:hypothetical protein
MSNPKKRRVSLQTALDVCTNDNSDWFDSEGEDEPRTNTSYRNKIVTLTAMYEELKKVKEGYLCGYRMEVRVRGISSIYDAYEMAQDFFNDCDLPHVRLVRTVTIDEFFKRIRNAINAFRKFTIGRNQEPPTQQAKHLLARLNNAFGFSIGR